MYFQNTDGKMLQENKLLEEKLLAFYALNECLFILLEQPNHMAALTTGGEQPAPVAPWKYSLQAAPTILAQTWSQQKILPPTL